MTCSDSRVEVIAFVYVSISISSPHTALISIHSDSPWLVYFCLNPQRPLVLTNTTKTQLTPRDLTYSFHFLPRIRYINAVCIVSHHRCWRSVHLTSAHHSHVWNTDTVVFYRFNRGRNRQRLFDPWRPLHRVCSTLPAETSPDNRVDRWMAQRPWPSCGCLFHRIRDLGSSLDCEGLFSEHT